MTISSRTSFCFILNCTLSPFGRIRQSDFSRVKMHNIQKKHEKFTCMFESEVRQIFSIQLRYSSCMQVLYAFPVSTSFMQILYAYPVCRSCIQVQHSGPVCRSHVNPLCLGLEELYNCVYRTCSLSCIQVSLSRLQEDLYAGLKELCTGSVKALPLHRACIAHRILSPLLEATAKADEVLQRILLIVM